MKSEEHSSNPGEEKGIINPLSNEPQHDASRISATAADAKALIISASDKAGMQNIDRERINAILMRESGNSAFMQRQKKLDEKSDAHIREMKKSLQEKDAAGDDWKRQLLESTIDPMLGTFQAKRRSRSTCAVIDMDGFFISCHILSNPQLASIPACVGGSSMISTSNYIARRYGVRAAMPGYLGSMLVKELSGGKETLTFVRSDFELYKRKSSEVKSVLEEYDPYLKMHSLDEAYLDIGPYLELKLLHNGHMRHEDIKDALLKKDNNSDENNWQELEDSDRYHVVAQNLLHSIRQKVKNVTGLTCSGGLASNFLISKVASDANKPNGQYFVGPSENEIRDFVHPLACRKINGIGRVMEKTLRGALGIETVQDLYNKRAQVFHLFKPATAQFLMRASIGYSESTMNTNDDDEEESVNRKGISHERTFSPISDWPELCAKAKTITQSLVQDLKERRLRPKTITVKVKLTNFDLISKTASREIAFFQPENMQQSSTNVLNMVLKLLKDLRSSHLTDSGNSFAVRLLGVRCSNFQVAKDTQISLDRYCADMHPNAPAKKHPNEMINPGSSNVPCALINPYKYTSSTPIKRNSISHTNSLSNNARIIKSDDEKDVSCPICGQLLGGNDNNAINVHIDSCLNAPTVKQLAKEETKLAELTYDKKPKKKTRLADFFNE